MINMNKIFSQQHLKERLKNAGKEYIIVLLSEIFPDKLRLFEDVDAYVDHFFIIFTINITTFLL